MRQIIAALIATMPFHCSALFADTIDSAIVGGWKSQDNSGSIYIEASIGYDDAIIYAKTGERSWCSFRLVQTVDPLNIRLESFLEMHEDCAAASIKFQPKNGTLAATWEQNSVAENIALVPDYQLYLGLNPGLSEYPTAHYAGEMRFYRASTGGNCVGCEWIVGEGIITSATPKRFAEFIQKDSGINHLRLDSPGGDLQGGLELGELIRAAELDTFIGRTVVDEFVDENHAVETHAPGGQCLSACAYAFLGGVTRYVSNGFELGFHQFFDEALISDFSSPKFSGLDRYADQLVTGEIVRYVNAMGIDAQLYPIVASVGFDEFVFLRREQARDLQVDNSDDTAGPWRVSAEGKGLIAELDTRSSERNVGVFCDSFGRHFVRYNLKGDQSRLGTTIVAESEGTVEFEASDGPIIELLPGNRTLT